MKKVHRFRVAMLHTVLHFRARFIRELPPESSAGRLFVDQIGRAHV